MKPTTTRTLNPLPFGDLEPHRFEDLIRQLAYDLRRWKTLEATGRGGADDGVDIRGVEIVTRVEDTAEEDLEGDADDGRIESFDERLWIFQCKREKSFGPKQVRSAVKASLDSLPSAPHGFVLAVACDVSKAARDAFRSEMVARGIAEFLLWAKGELEDMLFQPKNDRLLFAYFGIALQPSRRNLATTLRSEIAKKKQLTALLKDDEDSHQGKLVLLRDPTDDRYPRQPKPTEPPARWLLSRALTTRQPGYLVVLWREHLAATTPDGTKWDAIFDHNAVKTMAENELRSMHSWAFHDDDRRAHQTPYDFWNEYIPEGDQAYLKIRRAVPLDRILALDLLGDGYYPVPHVLVEFDDLNGPFTPTRFPRLERTHRLNGGAVDLNPDDDTHTTIFPRPLPDEDAPPPAGFDDTRSEATPLSEGAEQKVKELLELNAKKGSSTATDEDADARAKRLSAAQAVFREWRDRVAVPVLSAFVMQLRAGGYNARVVVRSVTGTSTRQTLESVELRVRLGGAGYRRPGHIGLSRSEYNGWRLETSPEPEDGRETRGRYAPEPTAPKIDENMTAEHVEGHVLAMLERLHKRGY